MNSITRVAILALAASVGFSLTAYGQIIYSDDFNDNTNSGWTYLDRSGGTTLVPTTGGGPGSPLFAEQNMRLEQTVDNYSFPQGTGGPQVGGIALSGSGVVSDNYTISLDIDSLEEGNEFQDTDIVFGYSDEDNFFYVETLAGGSASLYSIVDGVRTNLGGTGITFSHDPIAVLVSINTSAGDVSIDYGGTGLISLAAGATLTGGLNGVGGNNDAYAIDNFVVTQIAGPTGIEWILDADGSYSVDGNWSDGIAPGSSADVIFGNAITADRTVTIDTAANVNKASFSNANAVYTLVDDGTNSLTLVGAAEIAVAGDHRIEAVIAGTAGLTKTNSGQLFLSGNNTYTGVTDIQRGRLRIENINSVNDTLNIGEAGQAVFQGLLDMDGNPTGGGANGTFSPDITGTGSLAISNTLSTEVITFDTAKNFNGPITVNGGTLRVTNSGALGSGGTGDGTLETAIPTGAGKLELAGGVNIANEVFQVSGRDNDSVQLGSTGNNTYGGHLDGQAGGENYNIESNSGTLTLSGTLSATDTAANRTFVFDGAGDVLVTGKITDLDVEADGTTGGISAENNVNVVKRGSGTLTIGTATADSGDYWFGDTTVEQGTLAVTSSGGDVGELRSRSIDVKSGATLDTTSFGVYNMQVGQTLSGGGTVVANTLGIFDDGFISPGDNRGTLTIDGSATFQGFNSADGGFAFELGATTAVGGDANDLIAVSGSLSLTGSGGSINVIPVEGQLATGTYNVITASSVSGAASGVFMTPQITNATGDPLTTRQSVSVTNTGTSLDLVVSGTAANLVWNGNLSENWEVNSTSNWQNGGGSDVFIDLDQVTFDDTATTQNVNVTQSVYPGRVNMNQSGTYQIAGSGSVNALGSINMNSGVTALATASNSGSAVNVASGATFQAGSSAGELQTNFTGDVVASSGSVLRIGDDGFSGVPPTTTSEDFESFASGVVFQNNQTEATSPLTGWQLIDGRSSTSTQTGGVDDVVMELNTSASTGVALFQTNPNTDFPDGGSPHNGSMAISPLDSSQAIDTITATIGQDDPSGGFADTSVVFGYVDQDNYFYAQVTQGQGLFIFQVVDDVRSTLSQANAGGFANNTPWDVTLVHDSAAGTASFTVTDGTNAQTLSASDGILQQDGLVGVGSHNDAWFVDNIAVTTQAPSAAIFTVDGDLELQAGSTLQMDVASTGNLDRLIVNGNLDAAGTLELNATSSFMGSDGQIYDLIDFTTATGAFSSFNLPTLGAGLTWDTSNILVDGTLAITMQSLLGCDFDGSGVCELVDIDALVMEIVGGAGDLAFDINGDGSLDIADVQEWLSQAGNENIGAPYLNGDANLDGVVDVSDFGIWNSNKFTTTGRWSLADFTADGVTDVSDFGVWNGNKFTSSNDAAAVPEPTSLAILTVLLAGLIRLRRRSH